MSIRFVASKSQELLEQYYALREECFRSELGVEDFDGREDELDRSGTVLLAIGEGGRVIAGIRVVCGQSYNPGVLVDGAAVEQRHNSPPVAVLGTATGCFWSRLVIHPEHRSNRVAKLFLAELLQLSAELGFRYAFMVSDASRSRFYSLLHSALGYNFQVIGEIAAADQKFSGLEHLLGYVELKPFRCNSPVVSARNTVLNSLPPRSSSRGVSALMAVSA